MKNMSILDFQEKIVNEFKNNYPNYDIEINDVIISKGKKTGIVFKVGTYSPIFYIKDLYGEYLSGTSIDGIMKGLVKYINDTVNVIEPFNIMNFDEIKKLIIPEPLNTIKNSELLASVPYRILTNDISYVYKVIYDNGKGIVAEVTINFDLLKLWNKNIDEIHSLAFANLSNAEYIVKKLDDVIFALLTGEIKNTFKSTKLAQNTNYIVGNYNGVNGARHLLNSTMLNFFKDGFNKDFIIFPTNLNELVIISISEIDIDSLLEATSTHQITNINFKDDIYLSNYPLIFSISKNKLLDIKEYIDNIYLK